jgi:hypothetical protein
MHTYSCTCGRRLFFNNTVCVGCGSEVGWCEACHTVAPLEPDGEAYRCGNPKCRAAVVKCHNYAVEAVCNRVFAAESAAAEPAATTDRTNPTVVEAHVLCKACRLNDVIPDLSIDGNRERWAKLELGKRRLLVELDDLGLRYASEDVRPDEKPLRFAFQASTEEEHILTGHADGMITINLNETDSVERERLRKQMHEPHRTIIGHYRHEIGHYFWMTLVEGRDEAACVAVFGDHTNPPYADALKLYYETGPAQNWQSQFVSAYATAHPWEDFAETWGFYLDMWAVVTTMHHHLPGIAVDPRTLPVEALVKTYQQIGVFFNEVNRTMGLKDLVPEIISPQIIEKLAFIHSLIRPAPAK